MREVIVVLPPNRIEVSILKMLKLVDLPNLNVIVSDKKGQVSQRAFGIRMAKSKYIIQMDDDISIEPDFIESLFHKYLLCGGVIGVQMLPKICNIGNNSKLSLYKKHSFVSNIFNKILGFNHDDTVASKISKAGTSHINTSLLLNSSGVFPAEWVAGGFQLYEKRVAILDDFYPFLGKAYCEDLIQSVLFRKLGVQVNISTNHIAFFTPNDFNFTVAQVFQERRARLYLLKMLGYSSLLRPEIITIVHLANAFLQSVTNRKSTDE